jgi:hypothetical protein
MELDAFAEEVSALVDKKTRACAIYREATEEPYLLLYVPPGGQEGRRHLLGLASSIGS